jgi:putative endonuclease
MMTNKNNTVLYTGMTNDLERRVMEHKRGEIKGFTSKYKCHKLVYFEVYYTPMEAINREKQIKGGSRAKKEALINKENDDWIDLAENWN